MQQGQFRVILKGYKQGKGEYYIEEDFGKLFKITQKEAKSYFSEIPKTLKENLQVDEAEQFKSAINDIGADCEIEDMRFDLSGLSLE